MLTTGRGISHCNESGQFHEFRLLVVLFIVFVTYYIVLFLYRIDRKFTIIKAVSSRPSNIVTWITSSKKEITLTTLADKQAQFESFYLIAHEVPINITPASEHEAQMDQTEFEANMPYAFKIATEMSEIEAQALRPFRNMGEKFEDLVAYLQLQAKKMDLMMSYILQQQDDEQYRAQTVKFGGGGLVVKFDKETQSHVGDKVVVKLFLEDEAAAVYCFAEAIEVESEEDNQTVKYYFTHIREQDQELLVRASLHLQTKQLRKQKRD